MKGKDSITGLILVLFCTLIISLCNAGFTALGFADAAEFALVTKLMGIAHPPGFPAYVLLAGNFAALLKLFGLSHITSLVLFSTLCMALAACFLYLSAHLLLRHSYDAVGTIQKQVIAACTAIAPVTGTTIWHWSHSVEVYSLQVLSMSLLFYGLCERENGKLKIGSVLSGMGLGLGLANHHLSTILFLPFLILLWPKGWLQPGSVKQNDKKQKPFFDSFLNHESALAAGIASLLLAINYGWMYFRSGAELNFAFGSPDTAARLFYHLSGGAWINNTTTVVKGIMAMRLPYFLRISFEQFFLFIPFLLLGLIYLINSGRIRLWLSVMTYFVIYLLYQLRIDQTADTDAYLCAPFFVLYVLVPFGMARVSGWYASAIYVFPAFLMLQTIIQFPKTDLRAFDLSKALLRDLDCSAPENSLILVADWTTMINYTYAREENGFRKDLTVLNYDIKFTHFELLKRNYPQLYKEIAPAYDHYVQLLGDAHPREIYNTGCTLDNPALIESYRNLIVMIRTYCRNHDIAFMADPRAYVFLTQLSLFNNAQVSGCYVSDREGIGNDAFLQAEHQWLSLERVKMDPSASDKLVDLEAAFDFQQRYWNMKGDKARQEKAEAGYRKIKKLERQLKKKMPFLFRPS